MKITVDVDLTPEEARRFLGLPDLEPMQQAILKDVQERLQKNIARVDPDALMKTWFNRRRSASPHCWAMACRLGGLSLCRSSLARLMRWPVR